VALSAQLAAAAGRGLAILGRSIPGVLGPFGVAVGLWMAWRPLGVIFAGAALWLLDRRV
jgi:hypothetical protein